jgi:hypothetical protein
MSSWYRMTPSPGVSSTEQDDAARLDVVAVSRGAVVAGVAVWGNPRSPEVKTNGASVSRFAGLDACTACALGPRRLVGGARPVVSGELDVVAEPDVVAVRDVAEVLESGWGSDEGGGLARCSGSDSCWSLSARVAWPSGEPVGATGRDVVVGLEDGAVGDEAEVVVVPSVAVGSVMSSCRCWGPPG